MHNIKLPAKSRCTWKINEMTMNKNFPKNIPIGFLISFFVLFPDTSGFPGEVINS